MSWAGRVVEQPLLPGSRLPRLVTPNDGRDLLALAQDEREIIRTRLRDCGALLFRGFEVPDAKSFGAVIEAIGSQRLAYVYRSTPRDAVEDRVYTATVYPPPLEIPLHCENAYQRDWPMVLGFYCAEPPGEGGETPLADVRGVTGRIGPALLQRFGERGVRYVRNYGHGVDLPWPTVFQTQERSEVEAFCHDHDIAFEWRGGDKLWTAQVCQGTARHPVLGETVWFNQAHLFHVSSLGAQMADTMVKMFGMDGLPRHATYGDGEALEPEVLETTRAAFSQESLRFPWAKHDVLVLDNMQVAHGRRPYKGPRRVLAALAEPFSSVAGG